MRLYSIGKVQQHTGVCKPSTNRRAAPLASHACQVARPQLLDSALYPFPFSMLGEQEPWQERRQTQIVSSLPGVSRGAALTSSLSRAVTRRHHHRRLSPLMGRYPGGTRARLHHLVLLLLTRPTHVSSMSTPI
ncbi:uncharacterized protein LOC135097433 isoform X2 [Scylla paramamosain]|uniref:uncharacterized protein LOC135097433 isoform X2 n=1 Tax=Scylla paramamosain TaxID=85552 RepID=UPI00308312AB